MRPADSEITETQAVIVLDRAGKRAGKWRLTMKPNAEYIHFVSEMKRFKLTNNSGAIDRGGAVAAMSYSPKCPRNIAMAC